MLQDVRHAIRMMVKQRAFTAAALVTLALGIGATTAIFSMVYGVLLRPLPYPRADRLVRVFEEHPGGVSLVRSPMLSNLTYFAWRGSRTLEGLAAYSSADYTLTSGSDAERVSGAGVSPSLFSLLDARPFLGRTLRDEDTIDGAPDVVVLSHGLWRERFGAEPSALGRAVSVDGKSYTVVGVMAPEFYFPTPRARLWMPYRVPRREDNPSRPFWGFWAFGLLRPGATPAQAAAEGTAAARSVGPRPPAADLILGRGGPVVVRAQPLLEEITASVRPALLVLLVAVGLVLLIACANITNLLLSRGVARQRELAVRASLGAGDARLARQLLTEALVLSLAGGALGVALGWMLTRAVPVLAPADFPRLADVRMDVIALAFALGASLAAGLLAGALPAWRVRHTGLLTALRDGGGASASVHTRRIGAALLVAEAAVAVILLVGATLLGRSFVRLVAVDPGYDPAQVLTARIHLQSPPDPGDREETFANALLDRVRVLPGVTAAGISNMAPFVYASAVMSMTLRGDSAEPIEARALSYVITPGYADALSFRVREGRLFDLRDGSAGVRPILVNEAFARAHLSDGKPVTGRRFNASFAPADATVEIIGVVANVLKDGLDTRAEPAVYNLPRDRFGLPPNMNIALRTSADPLRLVTPLREAVRSVDASAALDDVQTLGSRLSASVSEPRFALYILMLFAMLALVLAAVGLYGVLSHQVLQRRRELGVRAALGATRGSLIAMVVRQGLGVAAMGIGLGLFGAAWLTRLMEGLLFGVTAHDLIAFGTAPVILLLVAIAATLIPARRAAAADPIEVLRAE